jgi:hypothetical protein
MIFSENRCTLFRIMLEVSPPIQAHQGIIPGKSAVSRFGAGSKEKAGFSPYPCRARRIPFEQQAGFRHKGRSS